MVPSEIRCIDWHLISSVKNSNGASYLDIKIISLHSLLREVLSAHKFLKKNKATLSTPICGFSLDINRIIASVAQLARAADL